MASTFWGLSVKIRILAACAALLVLGACETMYEPTLIQRDTVYNDQGLYIYSDLEESFEGERFWNFYAINSNPEAICLGLTLGANSTTSGHSFEGTHLLTPGQTVGVGYVYAPADFTITSDAWMPDEYGSCF